MAFKDYQSVEELLFQRGVEQDRQLIERDFSEYDRGLIVSDEELIAKYGKYGWY